MRTCSLVCQPAPLGPREPHRTASVAATLGHLLLTIEWHPLGIDADADDGTLHGVRIEGRALIVGRVGGVWHAADDACPHAGCAFSEDGALHESVLVCDCHGSEFDLVTGALVRGPATEPLTCVTVRPGATGGVEAGW